jgi:hypothetical protein
MLPLDAGQRREQGQGAQRDVHRVLYLARRCPPNEPEPTRRLRFEHQFEEAPHHVVIPAAAGNVASVMPTSPSAVDG